MLEPCINAAKLASSRLLLENFQTLRKGIIGTLATLSPEQIAKNFPESDVRSAIYNSDHPNILDPHFSKAVKDAEEVWKKSYGKLGSNPGGLLTSIMHMNVSAQAYNKSQQDQQK